MEPSTSLLSSDQARIFSLAVLVVLAAALVLWVVRLYRRNHYTLGEFPLYMLNIAYTRVFWRAEVDGSLRLGPGQGAVIVCNHRGPIDPGFVAIACDRPVHWMVAREYVEQPPFGFFLRLLRVIPVSRAGMDTAATKAAVRYAQQGELVGVFPEGRINKTKNFMMPGRPGAALIALKARVPVVPCCIADSPFTEKLIYFLLKPAHVHLKLGKPIDLSEYYGREGDKEVLEMLTKRFMSEIARLAGVRDFEPRLAGRRWKPGMESEVDTLVQNHSAA